MDKEYNVWETLLKQKKPIRPILEYINHQAALLREATEGKVCASFVANESGVERMVYEFGRAMSQTYQPIWTKSEVKDASLLYAKAHFEFIIYDGKHTYELVVFKMNYNETLPAELYIDPTISEEAGLKDMYEIDNLQEFQRLFVSMIKTHKVQFVINRLMQLCVAPDESDESISQNG